MIKITKRPKASAKLTEGEIPADTKLTAAKPTVQSVTINGYNANGETNIAVKGSIVITFSEAMNTSKGSVLLNNVPYYTGNGTWSSDQKTYTIPYSGLEYGTAYTVKIWSFVNVSNNRMADNSANSFSTAVNILTRENFPDENFRNTLKTMLSTGTWGKTDGKLTAAEAARLGGPLDLSSKNITDLTGIEYLTNLDHLYLQNNSLTTLDLSKHTKLVYLDCDNNSLTTLNVSNSIWLKYLYCSNNSLTGLDVSNSALLTNLACANNSINEIDLSQNIWLRGLSISGNSLTKLDVLNNTRLTDLNCSNNSLTELDLSNNTDLGVLYCDNNSLTTLNVLQNTRLTHLECYSTKITELDVSQNTRLKYLYCENNSLTRLNVSNNTMLKSLDFSNNPGNGKNKFPMMVWAAFPNTPPSGFTTNTWKYGSKTITPVYVAPVDKISLPGEGDYEPL